MAAPKVNRREKAKAETRQKVLKAARLLFERHGYEKTTLRDLAIAANMSTGAVFSNWKDKAELYEAVYGHKPITPEEGRALMAELAALKQAA